MDPDFTKNSDRDTPFRPSPDKSITSWLLSLVFVAGLLYAGYQSFDWANEKPVQNRAPIVTATPTPLPQPTRPQSPSTDAGSRVVTKCTGNGKTTYSDSDCPQGSATSRIVTKTDHNIVAGLTPTEQATVKRIDAQAATAVTIAQTSPMVTNASECKVLDVLIANLDALSRQPQSMQMQDWIRDQRKKARDRQFAGSCS